VIYWKSIPSDKKWVSPFKDVGPKRKFLTFEPDHGGWNNIRMAFESTLLVAAAGGRTLVMQPRQRMYLLGADIGFEDYYSIDELRTRMDIITSEEFIILVDNGEAPEITEKPSASLVKAAKSKKLNAQMANSYFRKIGLMPGWDPNKVFVAFPSAPGNSVDMKDPRMKYLQVWILHESFLLTRCMQKPQRSNCVTSCHVNLHLFLM
jgi:hypothetical protein